MLDSYFIQTVETKFRSIQKQYHLQLEPMANVVHYINAKIAFSVFFERSFEIYICFSLKNGEQLRLIDIINALNFEHDDIESIKKNQVTSRAGISFLLDNFTRIMKKVLYYIEMDPNLLDTCFEKKSLEINNQLLAEKSMRIVKQLNDAWKAKRFDEFLKIAKENQTYIEQTEFAKRICKQELYAMKHCGNTTK